VNSLANLGGTLVSTVTGLMPIAAILLTFQVVALRRPVPHMKSVLVGFSLVLIGMVLFLSGLDSALFPLGRAMATQLTDPSFVSDGAVTTREGAAALDWGSYAWVYAFGAIMGFSTTIAEPALMAVARKAEQVSGGTVRATGLRLAVACGAATGIALGTFRIVSGLPLPVFIIPGYVIASVQALFAPRSMVALAFDTGGVTTSTVTVPLVTALGLGLASTIPGRSPVLDGFGMIAMTVMFPMITVMAYAQIGEWRGRQGSRRRVPQLAEEG
jgi:hypothetical protein